MEKLVNSKYKKIQLKTGKTYREREREQIRRHSVDGNRERES